MATIIFVLVAVEELYFKRGQNKISFKFEEAADLTGAALFTVLVSVFAHGLSALPLAERMAQYRQSQRSIGKADEWDESALNDGIATPVVFVGLSFMKEGFQPVGTYDMLHDIVHPLVYAVIIGVVIGPLYAFMMDAAHTRKLCTKDGEDDTF
jgi:NhaP-type Na+/H+ or K+/H+ antiporter